MATSAGHAVTYTIGPIFKHIINCVQLYFINGFTNIVLVGVTLIFDGSPQIIVQRCQILAPKWPNDISSAADNAIFKNRAKNIFNFCEQKFVQHGPITIAIDCNDLSLLIFEEKWPNYASGPKSAANSDSFCVPDFCAPNRKCWMADSIQYFFISRKFINLTASKPLVYLLAVKYISPVLSFI